MKSAKGIDETIFFIFNALFISLCAISFLTLAQRPILIPLFIILFIGSNLLPFYSSQPSGSRRIRFCHHGAKCLELFLISTAVAVIYHLILAFRLIPGSWPAFVGSAVVAVVVESVIFWNGIITVYVASVQLGIKKRVLGVVFGLVPIAHLIVLSGIIRTVKQEAAFETAKEILDNNRQDQRICATKYPLLLVHGVFFRDYRYLNYWGRIPHELEINGAAVYYGNHKSASSVSDSAAELTQRIISLAAQANGGKVNIIAHSKGGLDCRYAIAKLGAAPYVASLTTINTPHQGCLFADYLLDKLPVQTVSGIARTYNSAMAKLGESDADFLAAVTDLTAARCSALDKEMPVPEGILCQSFGSKLNAASGGQFPLNYSYTLAKYFDGPNDGLVSEKSFPFGSRFTLLTTDGKRGISHGDMIDLNRENIPEFDIREFYVRLVADLKNQGL